MKKNKKPLLVTILVILVIVIALILLLSKISLNKNKSRNTETNIDENTTIEYINDIYTETNKNEIEYQENTAVEDLKTQTGVTANNEIFEIEEEYDGRKVLTVKPSLKYKVAFAGMIKNSIPKMNEIDKISEESLPQYTGIWIEKNSRNKILQLVNGENTNSKYYIDEQGYLKINQKNNQNDNDRKIENAINNDKQYILDISSVCYIIDNVTGEILDYNFEKMDSYQTYEYFKDENRMIIFINENSSNQLTEKEILESVINLI